MVFPGHGGVREDCGAQCGCQDFAARVYLPVCQGEGVGRDLVAYAEKRAKEAGFKTIIMHAMLSVVGFYEKLGYHQEGGLFAEQGITFAKMVKKL